MSIENSRKNLEKIILETVRPLGAEEATVFEVDVTNHRVKCTGNRSSRIYDAPYVSLLGDNVLNNGVIAVPEVNTIVLVVEMDRDSQFVVASGKLSQLLINSPLIQHFIVDEFSISDEEDLLLKVTPDNGFELDMAQLEFKANDSGMKLAVGSNDFKTGLQDLKTALEQLTVNAPNGPTSPPINVAAITAAMTKMLSCLQ
jgi:hypothetical protein